MKSWPKCKPHDVVRLRQAMPDLGLPVGCKGTVVLSYPNSRPEVVEVEFPELTGAKGPLATVETRHLEVVWVDPNGE